MRTGDEPSHARSPLRLRLALASFGLFCWSVGSVVFAVLSDPVWSLACAVGGCLAVVNIAVVVHRIRQGPHWQPGRDIPPYRPVEVDDGVESTPRPAPRRRPPLGVRVHRYLLLMGTSVLLLLVDGTWLWRVSMPTALTFGLIAMMLLPVAAITANAGSMDAVDRPAADPPRATAGRAPEDPTSPRS